MKSTTKYYIYVVNRGYFYENRLTWVNTQDEATEYLSLHELMESATLLKIKGYEVRQESRA